MAADESRVNDPLKREGPVKNKLEACRKELHDGPAKVYWHYRALFLQSFVIGLILLA